MTTSNDEPPLSVVWDGPESAPWTVILAHGAGAPMDSPFMEQMAHGLATAGQRVGRFEFPYMRRRRRDGTRRPPDPPARLAAAWRQAAAAGPAPRRLVIGGKSMGGRIASLVADELGVAGLACLGYPFHPPGRPDRLRTAHLSTLRTPTLIVQGERDPFGNRDEVAGYELSPAIEIAWIADGDHSFTPRRGGARSAGDSMAVALAALLAWLAELPS